MCAPAVAAIALVASAAVTAYGGYQQAKAQKAAGEYNYQVAQQNADIAAVQAQDAQNRGALEANEQRLRTRLAIGQQRAAMAANNVDLQTGTPLDVLGDTALFGAVDERRIRLNAAREAWGYNVQGMNALAGGQLDRYQGRTGAAGTYLTTAGNLLGMGYNYYRGSR